MEFLNSLIEYANSNPLLLVIAVFLFRDELFSLLGKIKPKPSPEPQPVPLPGPTPTPAPVVERPVVDLITTLLPTLLPVLIDLLKKQQDKVVDERVAALGLKVDKVA